MNKSWGRAAVALSIAALTLSACGDKDEPSTAPTPTVSSSSASPSSSGSPSASTSASASSSANASVPAAARARTEEGAIAFLEFYFDQINQGYLDPKHAPDLFAYADKECIACKKTEDFIASYAKDGWSVKQPALHIVEPTLAGDVAAPKVIINFTSEEVAQPLYKDGKSSTHKTKASSVKRAAALKWVKGEWQLFDLENL